MSYPNWVFSMCAFIGFLMVIIPLPWHLEAWNTGTCFYMMWVGLACLIQFINSIVWNGNAYNPAPIWCDITSRFMIGTAVAIPIASLCINRRLYYIASVKSVRYSKTEKRRAVMADLALCLGCPILQMILQYITQGHRYNIYEDIGCFPFTYNTWVAVLLFYAPPILIGIISAGYCIMSIMALNKSRTQIKEFLANNTGLSSARYFRLMLLAAVEILGTIPIASFDLYLNVKIGLQPYISWDDVHSHFSRVDQIPAIVWRSSHIASMSLEITRWSIVVCALVFFAFFGFADEARKNYRSALESVAKHVGYSGSGSGIFSTFGSRSKSGMNGTTGTIPVYVQSETMRKKDSIISFSDMSLSLNDVGGVLKSEKESPHFNEKRAMSPPAYESITLPDLGGVLADSHSSLPSSGSSSASSINSPVEPPEQAHTRPTSAIEISSVRWPSYVGSIVIPELPVGAPRHPTDTPSSVTQDSINMV